MTIRESADKAALEAVRAEKAQRFTVGGSLAADGSIVGGVTYNRTWRSGWGLTAYARAYWNDLPVVVHAVRPTKLEAGFEVDVPLGRPK